MKTESDFNALLDRLGNEMDQSGDEAVVDLIACGQLGAAHALFSQLLANSTPIPGGSPAAAQEFFESTRGLPSWMDPELLRRGEDTYIEYGPECLVTLMFRSLPQGYSMWHVAKTLHITGQLTAHHGNVKALTRRILETLQFLVNVMGPNGFAPPGNARVTTQKIRLIHSTIRTKVVETEKWDPTWKQPINQEEILMTMLTFSLVIIDGLRKLGICLNSTEQEGILHLWKVVAHVLGMHDELQPQNIQEARRAWDVLVKRSRTEPTAEGAELAHSLELYGQSILPRSLSFLPGLLLFHMNERQVRDLLRIERPHWFFLGLFAPLKLILLGLQSVTKFSSLSRVLLRWAHLQLIRGLIAHWNENQPVSFTIPGTLRGAWHLDDFCRAQGMREDLR